MKKVTLLLIAGTLFSSHLQAQVIQNGSFGTGDFTGWTTLGAPAVLTGSGPTLPTGTSEAWVQSTDADTTFSVSVPVTTIDTALGVTLPMTVGADGAPYPGPHSVVNGQAIYQTFTTSTATTLRFAYSFQSNDNIPYDSVGYVLNETYTELSEATQTYVQLLEMPDLTPTPYSIVSVDLSAGTYTLAFVAYNTGDDTNSTSLYVSDISVPEPSEWMLIALGGLGLLIAGKLRSRFCKIN